MIYAVKRTLCVLSAAALLALSGCGAGDGDVYTRNSIETVRKGSRAEYRMTTAKRGNITLSENVRVEYFAARQENLSFDISGLYYDTLNVSVGDEVKAGDVLAMLECAQIDADIASFTAQRAALEKDIQRNQELLELLESRGADDPRRRHEYEVAIRNANDECAVIDIELAALNERRAGRVIIAPIDGVITYVRDVAPGETSVNGRTVFTVTDLDSCAFSSTVQHPEALDPEAIYSVTIGGNDYEIMLSSAEELGVEVEPLHEKSTRTQVFFRLLTPSVNLSTGDSGRFTVASETRSDVLYVFATALTTVDGVPSVYVPDENGLMTVRNVETGLNTGSYVEIISGLEEGDAVILH